MKLILNMDFGDVLHHDSGYGNSLVGCPQGYYLEKTFREFILKSAENGFDTVYYRVDGRANACFRSDVRKPRNAKKGWSETLKRYDPLQVAADTCNEIGIDCYAWTTPFDNTWEHKDWLDRPKEGEERKEGFSWDHPEYELCSKDGKDRIIGVFSFGYSDVQEYFLEYYKELLSYPIKGVFLSDRTHSNRLMKQVAYGFNKPVIEAYQNRYGGDPRNDEHYDFHRFSKIQGAFYTDFLRKLASLAHGQGKQLHIKGSWNRNDTIAPRLGALHKDFFEWEKWVDEGIADALVIGGDVVTGKDPEFLLPCYETETDIVNPRFYRSKTKCKIPIYRWLTMQSWGWEKPDELAPTPPYPVSYNNEVVEKAIHAVAESEVDGLIMHEAVIIPTRDQWNIYRRFRKKYPKVT